MSVKNMPKKDPLPHHSPLIPNDFEHDLNMTAQLLPDLRPRNLPADKRLGWEGWQPLRDDIEQRVLSILGPFPERSPELNVEWGECKEMPLYTWHEVSYDGEPGERITACILIPKGLTGPTPAVLCPHGTSSSRRGGTIPGLLLNQRTGLPSDGCQYAWELAERGYITIVWDHFTLPPRGPEGGNYDSRDFEKRHPEWSPLGKMTWDTMRCVDFLLSLPQVDPELIGCIGMSLGGHTTLYGAAFDERIKVAVPACGSSTFLSDRNRRYVWVRESQNYHFMPRLGSYFDRGEMPPFEFHEVAAMVAPRPMLIISGYHDEWTHGNAIMGEFLARVQDIYDQLGYEECCAHIHHGEHHNFGKTWRHMSYVWLDRWLKD